MSDLLIPEPLDEIIRKQYDFGPVLKRYMHHQDYDEFLTHTDALEMRFVPSHRKDLIQQLESAYEERPLPDLVKMKPSTKHSFVEFLLDKEEDHKLILAFVWRYRVTKYLQQALERNNIINSYNIELRYAFDHRDKLSDHLFSKLEHFPVIKKTVSSYFGMNNIDKDQTIQMVKQYLDQMANQHLDNSATATHNADLIQLIPAHNADLIQLIPAHNADLIQAIPAQQNIPPQHDDVSTTAVHNTATEHSQPAKHVITVELTDEEYQELQSDDTYTSAKHGKLVSKIAELIRVRSVYHELYAEHKVLRTHLDFITTKNRELLQQMADKSNENNDLYRQVKTLTEQFEQIKTAFA